MSGPIGHVGVSERDFDQAFDQLKSAWSSHQELRDRRAPIDALADSSWQLFEARLAMGSWHTRHRRCE